MKTIPKMVHPLSSGWSQPKRSSITIQEDRVLMTRVNINKLYTYSTSLPSAKYVGKMWKSVAGDQEVLCWYGEHEDPSLLSINRLPIKEVVSLKRV
jgi:hypothetical protein